MNKKIPLSLILTLSLLFCIGNAFYVQGASEVQTKGVNLADINQHASGAGYYWNNLEKTLTLTNININTAEEYGFKIPANATIILKGKNYISAASVALYCPARVTIEGSGTLTLLAGDTGILCASPSPGNTNVLRLRRGKLNITAGKYGIYSEFIDVSFLGAKVTMEITGDDGYGVFGGGAVQMTLGSFNSNAPLHAEKSVYIGGTSVKISASRTALTAGTGITILENSKIFAGEALNRVGEYNGESFIEIKTPSKALQRGILFGKKYAAMWDYVTFTLIFLAAGTVGVLPIYFKRKKTLKLIEQAEKNSKGDRKKEKPVKSTSNLHKNSAKRKNAK